MMGTEKRNRWILLGGLLALTLGVSLWLDADRGDDTVVVDLAKTDRAKSLRQASEEESLALDALRWQRVADKPDNAFEVKSWYVAPPQPKSLPPPPPAAPPLPFTYLGRMMEKGEATVFLLNQDRNYAVKIGDVLEGTYRLASIETGAITLIYLPLNMQQTLATGGGSHR